MVFWMTLPLVLSKTGLGQDQQGADGLEECFDMLHEWLSKKEIVATDPCSPGVAKDVTFLFSQRGFIGNLGNPLLRESRGNMFTETIC